MKTHLTKRAVDKVLGDHKLGNEVFVWDDEIRSFGLRVAASGVATFVIQYRNDEGRTRRMALGQYGKLTPDQAREEAKKHFGRIASGEDPAGEKQDARKDLTFNEVAERYLQEHAELKKKASSLEADKRLLAKTLRPVLGSRKIKRIDRFEIQKLHHSLRGTPYKANRAIALLSKMFNLAEKWGIRPDGTNPCRHIEKYDETPRNRYLSEEELSRLGKALLDAEKSESPFAIAALRLILFTGARKSEVLDLRWSDVDLERGILNLRDSKTGAKILPLSMAAAKLFEGIPRVQDNDYVIPGQKEGKRLVGLQRIWERIRKGALLDGVRVHDLRHTFGSVGAWAGIGLPVLGGLLGHSQPQTTSRYVHMATSPLTEAANRITDRITEAMQRKSKVVGIKRD